jgi:hypothetical protein
MSEARRGPPVEAERAHETIGRQRTGPDDLCQAPGPLKFQLASPEFTLSCTATVVRPETIDAGTFELPSGMTLKKL